jgi:general secretion pathway protein B
MVAVVLVLAWLVRWALEGPPEAAWSSASQGAPLAPARPAPEGVREPAGGSRSAPLPVTPPAGAQATSVPAQGPVSALQAPAARPEGVPVSPASKRAPSGTGAAPEDGAPAVAGTGDATRNVGGRPQPQSVDATPPMSSPTSSARGSVAGAPVAGTQGRVVDAPTAPPRAAGAEPSAAPLPPLRLDELPVSVRRAIPALRIDGVVQSPSPTNRLLLVNGQVLRERETLIPGLRLEGIGPDSAIFTWRGQRFQLPYTDTAPRSP